MPRTRLLTLATIAVLLAGGCAQPLPSDPRGAPPASEAPPRGEDTGAATPRAKDEPPEPLTCEDRVVGVSDFAPGAKGGVTNILEATRTTEAINHEPNDEIEQIGATTQVVRDGEIIFVGEWQLAEDGTWLLGQYSACTDAVPPG
jgi:hypothetical protein